MAQRAILEFDAKRIIFQVWNQYFGDQFVYSFEAIQLEKKNQFKPTELHLNWLQQQGLVVKPDMLFGERGKNDLVFYKKNPHLINNFKHVNKIILNLI